MKLLGAKLHSGYLLSFVILIFHNMVVTGHLMEHVLLHTSSSRRLFNLLLGRRRLFWLIRRRVGVFHDNAIVILHLMEGLLLLLLARSYKISVHWDVLLLVLNGGWQLGR